MLRYVAIVGGIVAAVGRHRYHRRRVSQAYYASGYAFVAGYRDR